MNINNQDDLDNRDYITELNFKLEEFLSDGEENLNKEESTVNSLIETENIEIPDQNKMPESVTDETVENKFKQKSIEAALIDLKIRLSKAKEKDDNNK